MLKSHQTQRIYAMGARLGLLESGNKNDMLHTLVYKHSGKESIRSLTDDEYRTVIQDMSEQLRIQNTKVPEVHPYKKKKYEDGGRGKISEGQQRKVWQLMYSLEKLDTSPSSAKLGDRLCGIIRKELHIDCVPKAPFKWLTYKDGSKLIEKLKKYIDNAQRRKDGVRAEV